MFGQTVCQQTITPGTVIDALGHDTPDANGDCPRCHEHIKDIDQPTAPQEEPAQKQNFFQRIIQWLINFFAKLFGR